MGLEEHIAEVARANGWNVELRKRHGSRIQDLILERGGLILVVQVKDLSNPAGPRAVTQTKRDFDEYIRHLLGERLGVTVVPVLISKDISEKARRRALSYGIRYYRPNELEKILK
ncbi:MAG: restriction endonuclease [Candidatus Bathyarchaeia archaeon]|nr:restriction endonuclease [Candidatus Bathyarchaeota archaeon]